MGSLEWRTSTDLVHTGLSWISEIPTGWELQQLKYLVDIRLSSVDKKSREDEPEVMLCNYTDVYNNDLITSEIDFMVATTSVENIKKLELRSGDVIITKDSESWDDIAVPAFVPEDLINVICGYHLALLRSNGAINGKFLYWALMSPQIVYQLHLSASGITRYGLSLQAIRDCILPVPSQTEQVAIVEFLNQQTEHLDTVVRELRGFSELLLKKRATLINHAILSGIEDNMHFKYSYQEWIGDIPEHWEVEYARWLFSEVDERSTTGDEELLSVSHITGVTPRSEKDVNMFQAESLEGYKVCQAGDLVINTLWAWMGAMGVAFQEGIVSPAYHVYRQNGDYDPRYIDYLVRLPNFAKEVTRYSKGVWSSRLRLYPDEFFKIVLPVPPIEEQREIVAYLDKEIAKLDELSQAVEETIDLLQERRSALIAAAVTGKIRVTE